MSLPYYVCEKFDKIADYDFATEVPVTVLGHIFEQSVSDTEKDCAEAQGAPPPKTSKRKRDDVVYTPPFVTRFIVEETIGKTLSERFAAVRDAHGVAETRSETGATYDWTQESERAVWRDYRQVLRGLTIVDPACGSGAFLIAAFDYLAAEYQRVAERLAALGDKIDASEVDREILAHNLHGVDLKPEPVEITKLSLWLKTAKRGKLLQDLDASIKCGNSLIADKKEHGRAFDWEVEFPEFFCARQVRFPLSDEFGHPKNGIKTGLTALFEISTDEFEVFRGQNLTLDQLIKPFLVGDNVEKWSPEPPGQFIIRIEKGWTRTQVQTDDESIAWNWFANRFPRIAVRKLDVESIGIRKVLNFHGRYPRSKNALCTVSPSGNRRTRMYRRRPCSALSRERNGSTTMMKPAVWEIVPE